MAAWIVGWSPGTWMTVSGDVAWAETPAEHTRLPAKTTIQGTLKYCARLAITPSRFPIVL